MYKTTNTFHLQQNKSWLRVRPSDSAVVMCRAVNSSIIRVFDPLLEVADGQKQQYCLFPIQHHDLFSKYKQAVASFWVTEEVDLTRDRSDYEKLTPAEQVFLKHVLGFFAASDALVNENINLNFSTEVVSQEAQAFYAIQAAMEAIHSEQYSLLIDTIISDAADKENLFAAIETMPVVTQKAAFMRQYMSRENSFEERLIAFACVEGILFSASFCAIYFFKRKNLMPGLTLSNQFISRDEGLHTDFAVLLYSKLQNKLDQPAVQQIIRDAVEVECAFVQSALSQGLLGMNAAAMMQYVKFVADRLLVDLGCEKVYAVNNPFKWMDAINLHGVTSFFERKNDSYSKANVGVAQEEAVFTIDCTF